MRVSVLFVLLVLFLSSAVLALGVPGATSGSVPAIDTGQTFVSDILGTTPSWWKVETSFICAPDLGPYTCSYDSDCQRYFGLPSNYVCMGPGGLCNGHCEPC